MMMVVALGIVGHIEVLGGLMLRVGVSGNGDGMGGGCIGEVVAVIPVVFVHLSFVVVYYISGVEVMWQPFSKV